MRYPFIDEHKKAWPVTLMCGVLGVSRSGYYDWAERDLSACLLSNIMLDRRIREIFSMHRQRYGAPRIAEALHDAGIPCSENRVARRMRALGLQAIQAKKFKVTTDSTHSTTGRPRSDRTGLSRSGAQSEMDQRHQLCLDRRRMAVSRRGDGPVFTSHRRMVDGQTDDTPIGVRRTHHGLVSSRLSHAHDHSFGSGQPILFTALSAIDQEP